VGRGVLGGRGRGIRGPQLSPFKPRDGWKFSADSLSTQDTRISTVDDNLSYDFSFPNPLTKQRQKKLPLKLSHFQHMPNRRLGVQIKLPRQFPPSTPLLELSLNFQHMPNRRLRV